MAHVVFEIFEPIYGVFDFIKLTFQKCMSNERMTANFCYQIMKVYVVYNFCSVQLNMSQIIIVLFRVTKVTSFFLAGFYLNIIS